MGIHKKVAVLVTTLLLGLTILTGTTVSAESSNDLKDEFEQLESKAKEKEKRNEEIQGFLRDKEDSELSSMIKVLKGKDTLTEEEEEMWEALNEEQEDRFLNALYIVGGGLITLIAVIGVGVWVFQKIETRKKVKEYGKWERKR